MAPAAEFSEFEFAPESLSAAALSSAEAQSLVADTIVGTWELKDTEADIPAETEFYPYSIGHDPERVIGKDERKLVPKEEFAPGGKYRSVVKLFLHYQNQKPTDPWAMGTGWLIKPDLLVTAGHCAFDWGHKMGRLTQVKAYIGYDGADSISQSSVQFRKGKCVATTAEWLKSKGNKAHDVGFIQLQKPFTGVTPIKYADTPKAGKLTLGVVGYPGDLKNDLDERGAHMYQMFLPVTYSLEKSEWNMLEYTIDTFGGNSGSPVLRQPDFCSIGVHVYGGDINSASCIGPLGNNFDNYVLAFTPKAQKITGVKSLPGLTYVRIPAGGADKGPVRKVKMEGYENGGEGDYGYGEDYTGESGLFGEGETGMDEEGFGDFLKKALKIGGPIVGNVLKFGLPLVMGPAGAPVGALASIALNAAGKLAESTVSGDESTLNAPETVLSGIVERAILAEAALAGVMAMDQETLQQEGIFDFMAKIVKRDANPFLRAGPKILPAILEPSLRIALDTLGNANKPEGAVVDAEFLSFFRNKYGRKPAYGRPLPTPRLDPAAEAFVNALAASPDTESEFDVEGFFGFLKKAIQVVVKKGLPILINSFTESDIESPGPAAPALDGMAHRAILAEAALQALMRVSPETLEEKGIFDVVKKVWKTIAPTVIKVAPGVIKHVAPVVKSILTQESAAPGGGYGALDMAAEYDPDAESTYYDPGYGQKNYPAPRSSGYGRPVAQPKTYGYGEYRPRRRKVVTKRPESMFLANAEAWQSYGSPGYHRY